MARPDCEAWRKAMDAEKNAMDDLGVFDPAPVIVLPKGKNAIGLRWVFVWKDIEDSKVPKARIVAQGHLQRPDDYGNTYAPVAKMTSIRVVLAYMAREDLDLYTFDVRTAFLNAPSTRRYTQSRSRVILSKTQRLRSAYSKRSTA